MFQNSQQNSIRFDICAKFSRNRTANSEFLAFFSGNKAFFYKSKANSATKAELHAVESNESMAKGSKLLKTTLQIAKPS